MKLKTIGEFGLINKISKITKIHPSVIKGIGDDCAVLKYTGNKYLLFTTDMILEGVHFKLKEAAPQQIGYKALAVNISDIAACGGIPKWAVVSAGFPKNTTVNFAEKLYKGMLSAASAFNVDIVGGDTNSSDKIVISVAMIGETDKSRLVLRSGAKKSDIIFITGSLKRAPDDLGFTPKIKESQFLINNFKINSMIDISDGLSSDLGHIINTSRKGARIYESLLPYKGNFNESILSTGEQFELLFTVNRRCATRLQKAVKIKNIKVTPIGEITGDIGKITFITKNGKSRILTPSGYRHF
ncbi:MAG: thiamine-phosphate kinase [Candidatus Omnitrophica bacterium]|nr:thiamine-phosphate kinase [Candidatus Omnitrophota bacterium]